MNMTVDDLAERLGVSYDVATIVMKSPGFPSIRVGRRWLVDERAYERWYLSHHKLSIPTAAKKKTPEPKRKRKGRQPSEPFCEWPADWETAKRMREKMLESEKGA